MDDPPLARANNTELIRDVLAIMFHGVAFRTCPLCYGQSKNPTFCPIFSSPFPPPPAIDCPVSDICLPMCIGHRPTWRSSDRTRDVPETCYQIATTKREIRLKRWRESGPWDETSSFDVAIISGRLWPRRGSRAIVSFETMEFYKCADCDMER